MIFSGTKPDNLGVNDGKLADCPNSPNCVSSQSPSSDETHFIQPLKYSSTTEKALTDLKNVIESEDRTKMIEESSDYLYAEFKTALMGFVDDVEFYLDSSTNTIHVRSASRLGQSDLGVNRKRIETIRTKFNQMQSS
ncbi:DUF1499 domain-containing protein [Calothrix sp. CCY 0018]|uniref:DUF1499 domain-containing protein n=1 Tax=Calothrix sp. CCY 0018 TaxID=3103864 RepID=UPI0039C703F1